MERLAYVPKLWTKWRKSYILCYENINLFPWNTSHEGLDIVDINWTGTYAHPEM